MEDTLRVVHKYYNKDLVCVLILVLMEDTLREKKVRVEDPKTCLNPCFNGRYSQRAKTCVPLFIVV